MNLIKNGNSIKDWNHACTEAMESLNYALRSSPILCHPNFQSLHHFHADASQFAIGRTLMQIINESERVFSYFSKKLNETQMHYSANDRELLGMVEFCTHFRCYLEGAEFKIITNHQILKHFFDKKDISWREYRWLEALSDFGVFSILLKKDSIHVLGDALSRVQQEVQNISSIVALSVPEIRLRSTSVKISTSDLS